jgi:hypothetical protein
MSVSHAPVDFAMLHHEVKELREQVTLLISIIAERWPSNDIFACVAPVEPDIFACAAVKKTGESFFAEQDAISMWAAERLAFANGLQAKRADLLTDFNTWARANGKRPMHAQQFCETVRRSLGLTDKMIRGVRRFGGADLKATDIFAPVEPSAT